MIGEVFSVEIENSLLIAILLYTVFSKNIRIC